MCSGMRAGCSVARACRGPVLRYAGTGTLSSTSARRPGLAGPLLPQASLGPPQQCSVLGEGKMRCREERTSAPLSASSCCSATGSGAEPAVAVDLVWDATGGLELKPPS